jgi:hypothetical protein
MVGETSRVKAIQGGLMMREECATRADNATS